MEDCPDLLKVAILGVANRIIHARSPMPDDTPAELPGFHRLIAAITAAMNRKLWYNDHDSKIRKEPLNND